jgi:hypothetical protein
MTLLEQIQIQSQVQQLPPEKQGKVLDFIAFLQERVANQQPTAHRSLRKHPAFGSWRGRKINALEYQQNLRTKWDNRL